MKPNKLNTLPESQHVRWYAIISHLKPYALIWAINNSTSIQFKPGEFLVNENYFPKYCFHEHFPKTDYTIYLNRIESGAIFKDIKNADYLLKVEGIDITQELSEFLSKIKQIEEIKGVIPLAIDRLKKDKKILCTI